MKRLLPILAALALTGCSLFSSPTPKSNVHLGRAAVDGKGKLVKDADIFEIPNVWASDSVIVELDETYDTASSPNNELLQHRNIKITRLTDPAKAADVAIVRAMQTETVTEKGLEALATVGAAAIAGPAASGGAAAAGSLIDTVKEKLSGKDKAKEHGTPTAPATPDAHKDH